MIRVARDGVPPAMAMGMGRPPGAADGTSSTSRWVTRGGRRVTHRPPARGDPRRRFREASARASPAVVPFAICQTAKAPAARATSWQLGKMANRRSAGSSESPMMLASWQIDVMWCYEVVFHVRLRRESWQFGALSGPGRTRGRRGGGSWGVVSRARARPTVRSRRGRS